MTGNIVTPREKLAKRFDAGRTICAAATCSGMALNFTGVGAAAGIPLMIAGGIGWLICSIGSIACVEDKSPANILKEIGRSLWAFLKGGAIAAALAGYTFVLGFVALSAAPFTCGESLTVWLDGFIEIVGYTNFQELLPESWGCGTRTAPANREWQQLLSEGDS